VLDNNVSTNDKNHIIIEKKGGPPFFGGPTQKEEK
jgi:hypothetical protein